MVVEGYFLPHRPGERPTVLDVLGPAFAPRNPADVYIDNSVLEDVSVDEKADIVREDSMLQRDTGRRAGPRQTG